VFSVTLTGAAASEKSGDSNSGGREASLGRLYTTIATVLPETVVPPHPHNDIDAGSGVFPSTAPCYVFNLVSDQLIECVADGASNNSRAVRTTVGQQVLFWRELTVNHHFKTRHNTHCLGQRVRYDGAIAPIRRHMSIIDRNR